MMYVRIFIEIKICFKFFDPVNKNVIGEMKDQVKGKIISEFVTLKSKMCSLTDVDSKENKKAKGVNKIVVKNTRYTEFVDVLFNKKMIRHELKRIQSILQRIGTYDVCEICLSCFDNKSYILHGGIKA